jgi:6-phosphogluconolactonase
MKKPEIHILRDDETLHAACAERVVQIAGESINTHGAFHVALSGGQTPEGLYRRLAQPGFAGRIDWLHTHVWFGDERAVPPEHHDSNFRMARELLLSHVPIPTAQVHRIAGERPPALAAGDYAQVLTATAPRDDGAPRLDLVLLGVGLDGHIASLFPGTEVLKERKARAAAVYVEKLRAWRVTLTYPVLENARHVMLLVAGAKKADVVRQVLRDVPGPDPLPVQRLRPRGELAWYLDAQAGRHLDGEARP